MAKKLTLKGCPLCAGVAHWTKGNKDIRQPDVVQCLNCHLNIEGDYSPQSALELWNFRVVEHLAMKSDREVNIEGENL